MKLFTNHYPIKFSNPTIPIYRIRDLSAEEQREFKESHGGDIATMGSGRSLYVLPLHSDVQISEGEEIEVDIGHYGKLVKRAVRTMISKKLQDTDVQFFRSRQIQFVFRATNQDLLRKFGGDVCFEDISFRKGFLLDSHLHTASFSGRKNLSLVICPIRKWLVEVGLAEISMHEINLKDRLVQLSDPRRGRIVQFSGEVTKVLTSGQVLSIPTSKLSLVPDFRNLETVLTIRYGSQEKAKYVLGKIHANQLRPDSGYLRKRVAALHNRFVEDFGFLGNGKGFEWRVGEWESLMGSMEQRVFPPPKYRFHPEFREIDTSKLSGLKSKGPFSKGFFPQTPLRIIAVCLKRNRSVMQSFLRDLEYGNIEDYSKGFSALFRTGKFEIQWQEVERLECDEIRKKIESAFKANSGSQFDLAFIEAENKEGKESFRESTYAAIRAYLVSCGIPSQSLTFRSFNSHGITRGFTLMNVALASYAKMGGMPWALSRDSYKPYEGGNNDTQELVIGIGQARVPTQAGKSRNYHGITTIFTGEGRFVRSGYSRAVSMDKFEESLLGYLKSTLSTLKDRFKWDSNKVVRLVFHVFKPLKKVEVSKIKDCVKSALEGYHVEFAFLTVAKNHAYHLWEDHPNVFGKERGRQARKGSYFQLGESAALVGMQEPAANGRYSQPVRVQLHPASDFRELDHLCQQVFNFAALSYRSSKSSSLPITLLYSHLIAKSLGEFNELKSNPVSEKHLKDLEEKLWFL